MSFFEKLGRGLNQQLEYVRHGYKVKEEKDVKNKESQLFTWKQISIGSITLICLAGFSLQFYIKNNSKKPPLKPKSVEVKPEKPEPTKEVRPSDHRSH